MSESGYTPIQLYRSATASAVPTSGNLVAGELAINTTDEKLYFKNAAGTVKLLAANVTPVANGGTGATTATDARTNLGAQASLIAGTNIKNINSTSILGSGSVLVTAMTAYTGSSVVPAGTTGERDASPSTGYFRFNSTISKFEGYNGTAWGSVGGGATGGGSDAIFIENGQTVTTDYSIPSGNNAMSTGPIAINSGVTVTIPSGSVWAII